MRTVIIIGLDFSGVPLSVPQLVEYAKLAEEKGFDSVWIAEDYSLRDHCAAQGERFRH